MIGKPQENVHDVNCNASQGDCKKFVHRELTWLDLLSPFKFQFYKLYYRCFKDKKGNCKSRADEYAINSLSRTEVLFYKGLQIFEDDICIENILRSIHKLQSAVAALVMDNEEVIKDAKTLYYANQIIYRSSKNEKRMRFSTDFLEYLRYSVAKDISYHHSLGGTG